MEISTDPLTAAVRVGDERAAEGLIDEFQARVFAFLRRLTGNDQDAEDLTQRTFVKAWASLKSFAGRASLASWIHGIAHHVYVDWRRADHRAEAQPDEWWAACPAPGPGPAELAAQADLAHALYAAVDRLDPELRDAVHLHYYQGLSIQETADALGTAGSTVKYRLRNALDELQGILVRRPLLAAKLQVHRQP
jgi:RNA polymerase sigma-70 factor (ECF subfamily)